MDGRDCLKDMIENARTIDLDGVVRKTTGTISLNEAEFIIALVKERRFRTSMETGVAYGASTVAICSALAEMHGSETPCKHYGIDPCQHAEFSGAAIAALRKCDLEPLFELLEGPSHLMLPKLIERGVKIDLALIDGWHTFDYTLLDVFLADKLLRPGGILMMHDMHMPSKRKAWRYLKTHRKYRRLPGPGRPLWRRILSFGKHMLLLRPMQAWGFMVAGNTLLVAQKMADFEPSFDFYHRF